MEGNGWLRRLGKEEFLRQTLACLAWGWGVKACGTLNGSVIVAQGYPYNDYWCICDNGGEFHAHKVNSREPGEAAPYSTHNNVGPGTTAYRLAMIMQGEKIDWSDFVCDDIVGDAIQSELLGATT